MHENPTDDRELIEQLVARVDVNEGRIRALQARAGSADTGVVMARTGATEAGAFELIKRASQGSNRKVRLLADDVVLTGDVGMLQTR